MAPLLSTLESEDMTLKEAVEGLKLLSDLRLDDKMYKDHAATKFPLAKAFKVTKQ